MTASPTRRQLVFLLGSLLLAPLVTLYATQAVWLQSLWAPLPWMASHGGATVLFWVLFSSLSLTLYGFFRRLFPAYLPEVAVFMGVAVTSRYKLDINGAPLQLSDFAFVGNLGDITGYAASQLIPTLTTLLAIGVAAVLTETLRRKETWRPSLTQGFVLGSLCLTLFLSALYPGALQSAALRLDQNSPDQETRNERMGVVLGLYTAWAQRLQVETGTADPETTRLVDQLRADAMGPGTPAPAAAPDIIFVTSESFFDVTRLPGLTFSQDPLPNFHRLSETCTNGPFLSNTYGGGTGHVEMEMFTGLTSSLLKEGDTLNTLHTAVYQDLPTTVRLLQKAGYATTALHAHTSELYNRETIYPAIGFDTVAFLDDFLTPVEIAGKYASDDSFARELIARYEARDPSQPVFLYGMSMENHQTYTPEKYGQPSGFPAQCDKLSQEDLAILDALVMGLHHADASLGLLTDYLPGGPSGDAGLCGGPSPLLEPVRRGLPLHPPGVLSHGRGCGLGPGDPGEHPVHRLPDLDQLRGPGRPGPDGELYLPGAAHLTAGGHSSEPVFLLAGPGGGLPHAPLPPHPLCGPGREGHLFPVPGGPGHTGTVHRRGAEPALPSVDRSSPPRILNLTKEVFLYGRKQTHPPGRSGPGSRGNSQPLHPLRRRAPGHLSDCGERLAHRPAGTDRRPAPGPKRQPH
ncbi:MAG: LTA synthase family protein [Evtepia gabavorous]